MSDTFFEITHNVETDQIHVVELTPEQTAERTNKKEEMPK